jgi:GntR family transcriptional regulator
MRQDLSGELDNSTVVCKSRRLPVATPRTDPAQVVDRSSPLPVYFQIAIDVRRRIDAGEWPTGQRIAPELQLAREYAVSRVTVRQALSELVKDDVLERRRGSGTYLRQVQRPLVYDLNLTVGALASRWRDADFDNRAEVIETAIVSPVPDELRHRLQLRRTDDVVYLLRRVFINGRATVLYRSWFNGSLVPGLASSEGLDGSLSHVLTEEFGLSPTRSESELEVVRATREETTLLQVASDVPLVVVTATTYLPDGRPLEHSQLAWIGDSVRFHVTAYASGTA